MTAYLLDTNIASHIIRGDRPEITKRLVRIPMEDLAISVVTHGELIYGLAKRDHAPALSERVRQFLLRVDVLAWDRDVARVYGNFRSRCEARVVTLAPLDMMIAAHAVATDRVLVTRDKAFGRADETLVVEDWSER